MNETTNERMNARPKNGWTDGSCVSATADVWYVRSIFRGWSAAVFMHDYLTQGLIYELGG